jgi:hypothetical protein
MLSAFFRSEMPNPWPKAPAPVRSIPAPAPAPEADRPRRFWMISPSWSMAAAVALMLAGYTWLAGQFPQPQDTRSDGLPPMTGMKVGITPLPNGGEARFREERLPTGEVLIHMEESKRPSPMR